MASSDTEDQQASDQSRQTPSLRLPSKRNPSRGRHSGNTRKPSNSAHKKYVDSTQQPEVSLSSSSNSSGTIPGSSKFEHRYNPSSYNGGAMGYPIRETNGPDSGPLPRRAPLNTASTGRRSRRIRRNVIPNHPSTMKSQPTVASSINSPRNYGSTRGNSYNVNASTGENVNPRSRMRRRAYSEVNQGARSGAYESGFLPYEEEGLIDEDDVIDEEEDDDSSIYRSSNPSSREGSEVSSIDDVCFPVDSIDGSGRQKVWPDIEVLEEFAKEERTKLRKIQAASEALSRRSSIKEMESDGGGVNFEYPLVSNVDQGDSLTDALLRSEEQETSLIHGRLRPKKVTPWDRERRSSFHAKESMLGKYRYTYFREDMMATIHSRSISGLIHKENMTFADLFSPSYYRNKVHDLSQTSISPRPTRELSPQIGGNGSKLSRIGTSSTTPTPSVADYSHVDKQYTPPFWLDVCNPTEDEMKVLSKAFGIHPLTTEDIFLGEAREKVELFKDYYFVCFTSFDVAEEHHRQKIKEKARALSELEDEEEEIKSRHENMLNRIKDAVVPSRRRKILNDIASSIATAKRSTTTLSSKHSMYNSRKEELIPLNMYIVVFKDGVLTFHFTPSPHPGNVRRRARLLKDYLTVTSDWIGYALIDDITDAFAPLIESIETEVNRIEDQILSMQSGDHSDSDDSSDESDAEDRIWVRMKRRSSTVGIDQQTLSERSTRSSSSSSSASTKIISWKRKGDMLRRIGECRRRVMSLLRLLGSKPDVIKGFAKRCNEQWEMAPKSEIGLYLGDIQDHVVTMIQALNHYEKVLARSHSNYLAQINIEMTKVNNDMNDILGKITILGSIVLPLNVITGLWGMNCLVPGQDVENLNFFWAIVLCMVIFSFLCYLYVRKVSGIV